MHQVAQTEVHTSFLEIGANSANVICGVVITCPRVSAASALWDKGGLRSNALDWLLVAFPVDGGDGGRALQLEVAVFKVLLPHLEAEAQRGGLQTFVLAGDLQKKRKETEG